MYPRWTYDADKTFTMHENELNALPSIRFRFRGVDGEVVKQVNPKNFKFANDGKEKLDENEAAQCCLQGQKRNCE